MNDIKKLTKKEALTLIMNDMMRELCVAEINLKDLTTISLMNPTSNPEESQRIQTQLTMWSEKVKNMIRTMAAVEQMITSSEATKVETKLQN